MIRIMAKENPQPVKRREFKVPDLQGILPLPFARRSEYVRNRLGLQEPVIGQAPRFSHTSPDHKASA